MIPEVGNPEHRLEMEYADDRFFAAAFPVDALVLHRSIKRNEKEALMRMVFDGKSDDGSLENG